jgi:hypothetical protein
MLCPSRRPCVDPLTARVVGRIASSWSSSGRSPGLSIISWLPPGGSFDLFGVLLRSSFLKLLLLVLIIIYNLVRRIR